MISRRRAIIGVVSVAAIAALWLLIAAPRWFAPQSMTTGESAAAPESGVLARKIKARLFYVADDGTRLASVERDVAYAAEPTEQARAILNAQMEPAPPPYISAVPPGTTLRALFITPQGEAFVDLSRDVASAHPGGSMNEILTIYTIVHALTFNLPALTAVQLLVDGKEVDTLAGHVDLRRPLHRNLTLTIDY